jgi:2-polyprenyl-3-methyl-5-hydroxy-6-metoxy-1,4-benzoquinol methylase
MAKQLHKYEYEVKANSAPSKVVRMVGVNKRVLELGSGPGMITRSLKGNSCRVVALELDEKAIELVAPHCESVHACDLNDPTWPETVKDSDKFDVIVAGDVLEHLYNPWQTMSKLETLLADGGYVVLSLPHVGHNAVIACLLASDFGYQPWGLLDKTHIRFFCIKNMQQLFNDAGLKIIEVDYVVKTPEQTEFAQQWRKLSSATKLALGSNKFGTVYQVVIKAVPNAAPGNGLQLATQSVPPPIASSFSNGAKGSPALGFLISFLSLNTRHKIAQFLARAGIRL